MSGEANSLLLFRSFAIRRQTRTTAWAAVERWRLGSRHSL